MEDYKNDLAEYSIGGDLAKMTALPVDTLKASSDPEEAGR